MTQQDDITQRLRDNADLDEAEHGNARVVQLEREAADEIERLRAELSQVRAPVADERSALAELLEYVDRNTCTHEDTHRGGAIWTICDGCGMKWADDEGGFAPHQDAPAVAAARAALASAPVADERAQDVDLPWLRAYMHHQIASDRWVVTADQARDFARAAVLADRQARDALASAHVTDKRQAVAYLDLGAGGYMDVGTDLTDEQLAALPKGRHMLAIIGTHGVNGYTPAIAPVAGEAQERIEQMAVNRYRPVPDGKFSYKVVAGDGSRSLYTGTKDSCLRVAAKLTEAFLDGAFVASDASPQSSKDGEHGE